MEEALLSSVNEILKNAPVIDQKEHPNLVVFSDLHMGNGKRSDDFRANARLFQSVLEKYYLHQDYSLILNGDVEELQKFSYNNIKRKYLGLFELFAQFQGKKKLFKTVGNHDEDLWDRVPSYTLPKEHAYRIKTDAGEMDVLHGHQFGVLFAQHNRLVGWILRYLARPLGIRNIYIAHDSPKRYRLEQRAYEYARGTKRLLIMGHTHRPLFEALSKKESLQFTIESLLTQLPGMSSDGRKDAEIQIKKFLKEFRRLERKKAGLPLNRIYSDELLTPNLFNSGCAIGTRGMTALEITGPTIRLVHWYDSRRGQTRITNELGDPKELGDSGFFKRVLREDTLESIFDRIRLLSGSS